MVIPFTKRLVLNKELVIRMLQYEEEFTKSDMGQQMYRCEKELDGSLLNVIFDIHKITLDHFDFDTSEDSVKNYRFIFLTYYKNPQDYDKDVISASFYMRNNKCVFYEQPKLLVGDELKNCPLYELDGKTQTTLFDAITKHTIDEQYKYVFVGAFSGS